MVRWSRMQTRALRARSLRRRRSRPVAGEACWPPHSPARLPCRSRPLLRSCAAILSLPSLLRSPRCSRKCPRHSHPASRHPRISPLPSSRHSTISGHSSRRRTRPVRCTQTSASTRRRSSRGCCRRGRCSLGSWSRRPGRPSRSSGSTCRAATSSFTRSCPTASTHCTITPSSSRYIFQFRCISASWS